MFPIPILLITYKRPEKVELVIQQINATNPAKVYVFNDYAADENVRSKVDLTKQVVKEKLRAKLIFENFATKNLGCKDGPETAISWFFEHEEYGIILEEDCLASLDFFKFCEEMLIRYKNDQSILQINGTNLISSYTIKQKPSYYLSSVTSAWGWATWRRAWNLNDINIQFYNTLVSQGKLNSIYPDKKIKKLRMREVESVLFEHLNTWDYTWRLTVNLYGFAITPKVNLVKNIGFDEEATHTFNYNKMDVKDVEELHWPLTHSKLVYDKKWDTLFYKKLYPQLYKKTNFKIIKRLLTRWIGIFKKLKLKS